MTILSDTLDLKDGESCQDFICIWTITFSVRMKRRLSQTKTFLFMLFFVHYAVHYEWKESPLVEKILEK